MAFFACEPRIADDPRYLASPHEGQRPAAGDPRGPRQRSVGRDARRDEARRGSENCDGSGPRPGRSQSGRETSGLRVTILAVVAPLGRLVTLECKTGDATPTAKQRACHAALIAAGAIVRVVR